MSIKHTWIPLERERSSFIIVNTSLEYYVDFLSCLSSKHFISKPSHEKVIPLRRRLFCDKLCQLYDVIYTERKKKHIA